MSRDTTSDVARNLVSHPYRRILLALLDCYEPPVTTRAVAQAVCTYDTSMTVGVERTLDEGGVCEGGVEQMAAQLHHNHLPRLASAGVLSYDRESSVVTDWEYPSVGDRWVTSPPVDSLARTIAAARLSPAAPSD